MRNDVAASPPVLPPTLSAVALALAGVRTGAHVLDLTPAGGLGPALSAGVGPTGRVTDAVTATAPDRSGAGYALLVDQAADPAAALKRLEAARPALAPGARVTLCCAGNGSALLLALAHTPGWSLVHLEHAAEGRDAGAPGPVFAVLRPVDTPVGSDGASRTPAPGGRWV